MKDTFPIMREIIDGRAPCYFISPHPDDAALSAGGLMSYLSKRTKVEAITVFSEGGASPYTLSAKRFLRRSGAKEASELYGQRREEDRRAFAHIGIIPQMLGFVDGLWRKRRDLGLVRGLLARIAPELAHIYPIFRIHLASNVVSEDDLGVAREIALRLRSIVKEKNAVIFCPLAIDTHVDHVLIRDVCLDNFTDVVLWSDLPYHTRHGVSAHVIERMTIGSYAFSKEQETKERMIREYSSQVNGLYPDGIVPDTPEIYYLPRRHFAEKNDKKP